MVQFSKILSVIVSYFIVFYFVASISKDEKNAYDKDGRLTI
jgi:hypothetical protein